jgi:hypothetical protein
MSWKNENLDFSGLSGSMGVIGACTWKILQWFVRILLHYAILRRAICTRYSFLDWTEGIATS